MTIHGCSPDVSPSSKALLHSWNAIRLKQVHLTHLLVVMPEVTMFLHTDRHMQNRLEKSLVMHIHKSSLQRAVLLPVLAFLNQDRVLGTRNPHNMKAPEQTNWAQLPAAKSHRTCSYCPSKEATDHWMLASHLALKIGHRKRALRFHQPVVSTFLLIQPLD